MHDDQLQDSKFSLEFGDTEMISNVMVEQRLGSVRMTTNYQQRYPSISGIAGTL